MSSGRFEEQRLVTKPDVFFDWPTNGIKHGKTMRERQRWDWDCRWILAPYMDLTKCAIISRYFGANGSLARMHFRINSCGFHKEQGPEHSDQRGIPGYQPSPFCGLWWCVYSVVRFWGSRTISNETYTCCVKRTTYGMTADSICFFTLTGCVLYTY